MLALSFRACKFLAKRSPFKQTKSCGGFSVIKTLSRENTDVESVSGARKNTLDFTRTEYVLAKKFLGDNTGDAVDWEELVKILNENKVQNPYVKILQACLMLKKPNLGVDFHKYLIKENKQLEPLDLMFFCRVLQKEKKQIEKFEQLLIKLYKDIRESVMTSTVIRSRILDVFVEIPNFFDEIVKDARQAVRHANKPIVIKAFEKNQPEIAYEFMEDSDFEACNEVMEVFINYLIERAKEGTFSVEMITRFTDFCERKGIKLCVNFELGLLKSLVMALNKYSPNYVWSVSESDVDQRTSVCSHCNLALLPKNISQSDMERLKSHFLEKVLKAHNIFLSSTEKELEKFIRFLNNCRPFNLVIDGLNFYYIRKNTGSSLWSYYLKYFLSEGYNILIIGKEHSKKHLIRGDVLFKKYSKRIQFFFVQNFSNDDLFVLYAALHKGPNTYICSGDFLLNHGSHLNFEMRTIYQKWLLSHHYILMSGSLPFPPMPHCGFSQLTSQRSKGYIWHLSKQPKKNKIIGCHNVEWFCLQATLKEFPDAAKC